MRKVWVVVRREFVERVRSKWFIVSTVLGPLLMVAFLVVPIVMAGRGGRERHIAVVDASGSDLGQRLMTYFSGPTPIRGVRLVVAPSAVEATADSLTAAVGEKKLDGYLLLTSEAVENGRVEYRGSNVSSPADMSMLERIVREVVMVERLGREGVDPQVVAQAQIPVSMRTVSIRGGKVTEESGQAAFLLAYGVWLVLYMAIFLYGVQVMGSVVEEKTSRIVEVLVSSLRPFQLLAGKIIGVGAVGVFQFLIWGASAWLLFERREQVLHLAKIQIPVGESLPLPHVPIEMIVIVVVYFLLGYFLYAAMFAAVAAMSNSEAEARQAQLPVTMLLVIPTILMIGIIQQPDSGMALMLSLIPFTAPIAMPVRWAAAPIPLHELVLSIVLLVVALWLVIWAAGRIYRVGILMYGKRPNLRELVRWVRQT
jgi:ABC-2 type transport system permease protein